MGRMERKVLDPVAGRSWVRRTGLGVRRYGRRAPVAGSGLDGRRVDLATPFAVAGGIDSVRAEGGHRTRALHGAAVGRKMHRSGLKSWNGAGDLEEAGKAPGYPDSC